MALGADEACAQQPKTLKWLHKLTIYYTGIANITVTPAEIAFLKRSCPYLNDAYLDYLRTFQLKPSEQIHITFTPSSEDTGSDDVVGDVEYAVAGLWVETILYEIPLLALTSEAYFKFVDRDWTHDNQEENAYGKGVTLLENGCIFSEFGSRRRRDYHTHDLVMKGLTRAAADKKESPGKLSGTSNVHFAMKYDVSPVGTVAHEWYMGIAAYTDDYENANELGLRYWLGCFGEGVCQSSPFAVFIVKRERERENANSVGPRHRAHRHLWHARVPRRLQQAHRGHHHAGQGRRRDPAVQRSSHRRVDAREPGRHEAASRSASARCPRHNQQQNIRTGLPGRAARLGRSQELRQARARILRHTLHHRQKGHRLLGLAQSRQLPRVQGCVGGGGLSAYVWRGDVLHQYLSLSLSFSYLSGILV
jgi:Nicotinate phosphoribosyltransferase (NAPRTase) N-terminal domain/Nicotinate phosphoribosyltransferase (NAPRTase) family